MEQKPILRAIDIYKKGCYLNERKEKIYISSGDEGWIINAPGIKEIQVYENQGIHGNYNNAYEYALKTFGKLTVISVETEQPLEIMINKEYGFRLKDNRIIGVLISGEWVDDYSVLIDYNKQSINFDIAKKHFSIG